eukprot:665160-Pyramimonas_sp.AAC.2
MDILGAGHPGLHRFPLGVGPVPRQVPRPARHAGGGAGGAHERPQAGPVQPRHLQRRAVRRAQVRAAERARARRLHRPGGGVNQTETTGRYLC